MVLTLKLKKKLDLYLEADSITPDNCAGKSVDEIKKLVVFLGNRKMGLGEFFDVKGKSGDKAEDTKIVIEGNCSYVQRIGEKMSAGEIVITGDCGMHVGNTMTGGKILVEGNADDWVGAMMDGGEITVNGDAGNHCAGAYRGNWVGMNAGKIVVKGKIGVESGSYMRATRSRKKYPILECGSADLYLGVHNHGGTIICHGDCEGRAGADMARGQIFIDGNLKDVLPSFKKIDDISDVKSPAGIIKGSYTQYQGDFCVSKKPGARLYVKKK
ncbi:MAG: formylmethanofuran dehydrogenase subunit C [Candidatus Lokiarchaeota archaeon]|nr:formylmethanofuran dehydrogenase subunit C [Candidatus Lokiarchaeota archaeon]